MREQRQKLDLLTKVNYGDDWRDLETSRVARVDLVVEVEVPAPISRHDSLMDE